MGSRVHLRGGTGYLQQHTGGGTGYLQQHTGGGTGYLQQHTGALHASSTQEHCMSAAPNTSQDYLALRRGTSCDGACSVLGMDKKERAALLRASPSFSSPLVPRDGSTYVLCL